MKYLKNIRQEGEGLELLQSLENGSATLVFLDPQYEKADSVLWAKNWPVQGQTEYQVSAFLKEINRVLKPSGFCLLWVNKGFLSTDRLPAWLLTAPKLKVVDFLVWDKDFLGTGFYFRSRAEYAFLLQKKPVNRKKFTSRIIPSIWEERKLFPSQKRHPFEKPIGLTKAIILATTQENDLIVDPCAGSFVVLDVCQQTNRDFIGADLTFKDLQEYKESLKTEKKIESDSFNSS